MRDRVSVESILEISQMEVRDHARILLNDYHTLYGSPHGPNAYPLTCDVGRCGQNLCSWVEIAFA